MPVPLIFKTLDMSVDLLKEQTPDQCKAETENCPLPEDHLSAARAVISNGFSKQRMVCFENGFGPERKHGHFQRNVIPYSDHNYGQAPPMTPPGPCSPDRNEQTDTGNEDEDEEGITRCICGFSHDDGYMICCDKCSTWQHIECMGISSEAVPEKYLCDRCQPRTLDVEKAKSIQKKKRDENSGDEDNDDTDSDDEGVASYTAVSSTPTRITLTANASSGKKKMGWQLPGNRLTTIGPHQKPTSKLSRKKKKRSDRFVDGDLVAFWDMACLDKYYESMGDFETILQCRYEKGLDVVLWQAPEDVESDVVSPAVDGLCAVSKASETRKGLFASQEIEKGSTIIELKGMVSLTPNFKEHSVARFSPFTMFYNELDHMEFMIDSRKCGNIARYVRRSCTWNAMVKHKVIDGSLHFFLCAQKFIPCGEEIVVCFERSIPSYNTYLECACGLAENCPVTKHNIKFQAANIQHKAKLKALVQQRICSPLEPPRGPCHDSDSEDCRDVNVDSVEKPSTVRRKQLTREDRKLQSYLKQIEKMEKKEQKPRDPKQIPMPPTPLPRLPCDDMQQSTGGNIVKEKFLAARKCGKRKMSLSKGKRTRLSSCSSEPLSPDVDVTTTVAATPFHVSSSPLDPSVKPKSIKRDRLSGPTTQSLLLSTTTTVYQPTTPLSKRMKTDELAAATTTHQTGNQSPPPTPSQLSPGPRGLSVQTDGLQLTTGSSTAVSPFANSILANHVSPSYSIDSRRISGNGLLQVLIDASDSSGSSPGGSPHPTRVFATSGAVTQEETVGSSLRCDSLINVVEPGNLPSPLSVLHKRLADKKPYHGSLKKRWLRHLHYGNDAIVHDAEASEHTTISLSALMSNSLLHAKTAFTQSSQQSSAALYRLPLKKRRLKAAAASCALSDTATGMSLHESDTSTTSDIGKFRHDRPKLSLSSFLMSTGRAINNHRISSNPFTMQLSTALENSSREDKTDLSHASHSNSVVERSPDEGDIESIRSEPQVSRLQPSQPDDAATTSTVYLQQSVSVSKEEEECSDLNVSSADLLTARSDGVAAACFSWPETTCDNSRGYLAPSTVPEAGDEYHGISHPASPVATQSSILPDGPSVDVDGLHRDAEMDEAAAASDVCLSRSRSTLTDTPQRIGRCDDGERRESVSSTSSERSDVLASNSGGKKKMSLSEYRNRQRSKPATATTPSPTALSSSTSDSIPSMHISSRHSDSPLSTSTTAQSPPVATSYNNVTLSARADSLLTPRTLSLSSSFSGLPQQMVGGGECCTSPTGRNDKEADERTPSSMPMFEPVSPTNEEDCHVVQRTGDTSSPVISSSNGTVFNYLSPAARSVDGLPGTVYMHGQTFCYSSVGSSGLPVSTTPYQLPASSTPYQPPPLSRSDPSSTTHTQWEHQ